MAGNHDKNAIAALSRILSELGMSVDARLQHRDAAGFWAAVVEAHGNASPRYRFAVESRADLLPKTAIDLFQRMQQVPPDLIPTVYSPRITPRVAELAREYGISYLDAASNCWIRSRDHRLFISRSGNKHPAGKKRSTNVFSPKSSRIVRAMLAEPARGWHVTELAELENLEVSAGLASKTKNSLVNDGYAYVYKRRLYLGDPEALLRRWCAVYKSPAHRVNVFSLGEVEDAEKSFLNWCVQHKHSAALSHFSAAWRLASHVRYNVAGTYVWSQLPLGQFVHELGDAGFKRVETGANLQVHLADNNSVFMGQTERGGDPVVSPLQTYLDLQSMKGRGEDAAGLVYERYFAGPFAAAKQLRNRRVHAGEADDD